MLATQPAMRLIMETFILPAAWNTFSKPTPRETMTPNRNTIVEYRSERSIRFSSLV